MRLKLIPLFILSSLVFCDGISNNNDGIGCKNFQETKLYYRQKNDHFNLQEQGTWNQGFLMNNSFYKVGGPVLMYIQGETRIRDMEEYAHSQWMSWAQKLDALVIAVQHRYYQDNSTSCRYDTKKLEYLTSRQALADFANIVVYVTSLCRLPASTKWAAIGGSYGGTLAAWFRYSYPHLVHAAVASSAPMYFTMEMQEFEEMLLDDLEEVQAGCKQRLIDAATDIMQLIEADRTLTEHTFKLCNGTLVNWKQIYILKYSLYYSIAALQIRGGETAKEICFYLKSKGLTSASGFVQYINRNTEVDLKLWNQSCVTFSFEDRYRRTNMFAEEYMWFYQKCYEFGLFKTSKLFQIDIRFYMEICKQLFKVSFENTLPQSVKQTNVNRGGKDVQATNVIYTSGASDPWKPYTILSPKVNGSVSILIPGVYHDEDLQPDKPGDSEALKRARIQTFETLKIFLNKEEP